MYAAVSDEPVAPSQPNESLTPTAIYSGRSERTVCSETVHRRMSSGMSVPLSKKPDGTTQNAQVINTSLQAEELPNNTPFLLQVLVTPVPSRLRSGRLALAAREPN